VVLPAHVTQLLWYLCMLVSRVAVLAIIAYLFHFYVFVVVGVHVIFVLILLCAQRTTFCADLERLPSGELKFTRRWLLEVPLNIIAAVMYVFVYFNLKRGKTRLWVGIYHFVLLIENSAMAVLIYVHDKIGFSSDLVLFSHFRLVTLVGVVGLYLAGIVFMVTFYLIYHPTKTGRCFWIGIPRKCCPCIPFEGDKDDNDENEEEVTDGSRRGETINSRTERRREEGRRNIGEVQISQPLRNEADLRSQMGNASITISQPTLVSHNGFVPRNLLPVGSREAEVAAANNSMGLGLSRESSIIQGAPSFQIISNPRGRISREDRVSEMSTSFPMPPPGINGGCSNGAREGLERAPSSAGDRGGSHKDRGSMAASKLAPGGSTSTARASDFASQVFISPHSSCSRTLSSSNNTGRTASESNTVFLDTPASDIDMELSPNLNCVDDTVIDSPLVETTAMVHSDGHRPSKGMVIDSADQESKDVDSQKSCTDDTGIDMDSDNQLTQGTLGEMDEMMEQGHDNDESGYDYEGESTRLPVFTDAPATAYNHKNQVSTNSHWKTSPIAVGAEKKKDSSSPEPLPPPPMFQDQVHEQPRDSVTPTLPTPTYSTSSADLTPSTQRRQTNVKDTKTSGSNSNAQSSPEQHKHVAPRSPIGARVHQVSGAEKLDRAGSLPGHAAAAATRVPHGGMGGSSSVVAPLTHHVPENSPKTPRSPKGARRLQVQKQSSNSPASNPQLRNTANSSELGKMASTPLVPHPPVPPKDISSRRSQYEQNGLTRGLTSLVSPPADRAQSSSPMPVRSHDPRGSSIGPSGTGPHRNVAPDPRISGKIGVSNYSRERSVSSHHLSNSQRLQPRPPPQGRSPRVESWHENKFGASAREKRLSVSSGLASNYSRQIPTSSLTGQHHPADRRSLVALHGNPNLQSHPTPPRDWHSPPRGTPRSTSSPGKVGPPRMTKQGMAASGYRHQHSSHYNYPAYSHSPKYPRHPQGALGNNSSAASAQYKRPLSMPSHRPSVISSTNSDSIDEPLNLNSVSAAWSSASGGTGGSSSRGLAVSSSSRVSGSNPAQFSANPDDDDIYDKLEPEKVPAQVQLRNTSMAPPASRPMKAVGHLQPRPLSYHPALYVPALNAHESAV